MKLGRGARKEEKHPGGNIESMSEWKRKSGKGELVEFPPALPFSPATAYFLSVPPLLRDVQPKRVILHYRTAES